MSHILIEKPYYTHKGIQPIAEKYGVWKNLVQNAKNFRTIMDVLKIAYATSRDCFSEMCVAYECDTNLMYYHYSHEFVRDDDENMRMPVLDANHEMPTRFPIMQRRNKNTTLNKSLFL